MNDDMLHKTFLFLNCDINVESDLLWAFWRAADRSWKNGELLLDTEFASEYTNYRKEYITSQTPNKKWK